jgi:hypothetical protein
MRLQGGCHCRAVRFEIAVSSPAELLDCNCSICTMTGYRHLAVPHRDFTLLSGRDDLVSYRFGSGAAEHLFCRTCGIKSFYQPRSHPDCWSVHFGCLDPGHGLDVRLVPFDGRNWEAAKAALQRH